MYFSHIKLINWRNFHDAEADLSPVTYVIGPNASGKSNMLDAIRFLRDVAMDGVQKAVSRRGREKLISFAAAGAQFVGIEVTLSMDVETKLPRWKYCLHINLYSMNAFGIEIKKEEIISILEGKEDIILNRPDGNDYDDKDRLEQTALEQTSMNKQFREITDFFKSIQYLHLVPQFIKYEHEIGGKQIEHDPFGQGFIKKLNQASPEERNHKIQKINEIIPLITSHSINKILINDEVEEIGSEFDTNGKVHLTAYFACNERGYHIETKDFSDGTLRLIALFWQIQEKNAVILLEEPELGLNEAIVEKMALFLHRAAKASGSQVIVTTHSDALLSNNGIDPESILRIEPQKEGSVILSPSDDDIAGMDSGIPPSSIVFPHVKKMIKTDAFGDFA